MGDEATGRNLQAQRELYGESLGDIFRRMLVTFQLNQSQLAGLLGLSAPMLSQLMAGHRVKIGNPVVLERIRVLESLEGEVTPLTLPQLTARLESVRTTGWTTQAATISPPDAASAVRRLLREVAAGRELRHAAGLLQQEHPALAEVLLVYGTGSHEDAQEHYRRAIGS
ncbi:helix-turn-helix domain-containing protein [Serinibacter salmoneus]|uniref:Helix-turn-helix protein n=1 Tax=Serinibacter salmoneus TaxID=556530 RepID=A0A2A9D538_9MICO|nr:DNA-binding protein [Serinibacter salmoneus]PFG20970.1 hypothetical protein ATL40_2589 [Serinibacter salmoneus]